MCSWDSSNYYWSILLGNINRQIKVFPFMHRYSPFLTVLCSPHQTGFHVVIGIVPESFSGYNTYLSSNGGWGYLADGRKAHNSGIFYDPLAFLPLPPSSSSSDGGIFSTKRQ